MATAGHGMELHDPGARDDGRAVADTGGTQHLLGDPQPTPCADDGRLLVAMPLGAEPSVPDVGDLIGDLDRCGIVADDDRSRPVLPNELGQKGVDVCGSFGVELTRGLVRDHEPGTMGDRRTEGDALLLSAGELRRPRTRPIQKSHPLEELPCTRRAVLARESS